MRKGKNRKSAGMILFLLFNIYSFNAAGQQDTAFYIHYTDMLGLGISEVIRNNALSLERTGIATPSQPHSIKYNTNGKQVTGLIINYDKIYIAFGVKTENPDMTRKGKSVNTNLALNLHGNKLLLEATYRNYRGYYDENTPLYDTAFDAAAPYYHDGSLRNRTFKLKAFYFLNHKKFSYNAAYFGSHRQLKSAASWVLNANAYIKTIRADSSLIPFYARGVFTPYSYVNTISVKAFSLGGGAAGNVVIYKRFFYNATLTMGVEPQWRTYRLVNDDKTAQFFLSASLDFRTSFGYNSERFFMLITSVNDVTLNNSETLVFSDNFISGAFIIGYRFPFQNGATRTLKANKIYKAL